MLSSGFVARFQSAVCQCLLKIGKGNGGIRLLIVYAKKTIGCQQFFQQSQYPGLLFFGRNGRKAGIEAKKCPGNTWWISWRIVPYIIQKKFIVAAMVIEQPLRVVAAAHAWPLHTESCKPEPAFGIPRPVIGRGREALNFAKKIKRGNKLFSSSFEMYSFTKAIMLPPEK